MSNPARALAALIAGILLQATPVGAADEAFADYHRVCGYPLVYAPTRAVAEARWDALGRAIIQLDPLLDAEAETDRRIFLIAHECAHHRMGHATPAGRGQRMRSTRIVRDHELSADCWAAETLARLGLERPARIMADRFERAGHRSPGGGYPAGLVRSGMIRHCAEAGRTARLGGRVGSALARGIPPQVD